MIKDKRKGTYFNILGKGSLNNIKKLFSIPAVGVKIKQFLQNVVNTIANDVDLAAKSGYYATYENRKKLRECLNQLKKCGFTVSNDAYNNIKKLRRLEDFHNKIINLDFKGEQYPIEVWLEWKNGKNILHIHPKIIFIGNNLQYQSGTSSEQLVIKGFEQWAGDYKVFYSAGEGKQDLKVLCEPKIKFHAEDKFDVNDKKTVGLRVHLSKYSEKSEYTNEYELSNTIPLLSGWSQENPADRMILYSAKRISEDNFKPYDSEQFMHIAKHEFGHVVGIKDAYTYEGSDIEQYYAQYSDLKEDVKQTNQEWLDENGHVNMAMNNNGPILNNDIEMMILAWQTGKEQYFHLSNGGEEISEALGR